MRIREYEININEGDVTITADSFAPYKLGTAANVIVMGNMFVHGVGGCVKLRGGNMALPSMLQSNAIILPDGGVERYMFISPIVGLIKRASLVVHDTFGHADDDYTLYFYNEHGIEATTSYPIGAYTYDTPIFTDFDWSDPNDLAFCSVGVGTVFWVRIEVADLVAAKTVITVGVEIVPTPGGGIYV